jgi:hypothetical protein
MFRLSDKVTLEIGDKVRVSSGPYYLSRDGSKIKLGERGVGIFTGADPQGNGIYVKFERDISSRFVYIGPERISEKTATILRPHKITKIRKKKKS